MVMVLVSTCANTAGGRSPIPHTIRTATTSNRHLFFMKSLRIESHSFRYRVNRLLQLSQKLKFQSERRRKDCVDTP
jgi:hypothetical protein